MEKVTSSTEQKNFFKFEFILFENHKLVFLKFCPEERWGFSS